MITLSLPQWRINPIKKTITLITAALAATPVCAESLAEAVQENQPAEHCVTTGTVYRLDPNGVNNLSVRTKPRALGPAFEKDELFQGEHDLRHSHVRRLGLRHL